MEHNYCLPSAAGSVDKDSSRKRKRTGQPNDPRRVWDKRRERARINIGVAFSRWRELCDKLQLERDADLACVLLESFPAWKQHLGSRVSELKKRRRMAWVAAVRRKTITFNNISRNTLVCSRHFHKGKPAYEMLDSDPDWVPSLHLRHTEVNATHSGRFKRSTRRLQAVTGDHAAPAPLDVAGQVDEASTAGNASQMDDAGSNNNTAEQQECHLCSCRRAEFHCLLEENRRLKEELAQKRMDEDSFKDDDAKVEYYTGLPCLTLLMGVLTQLLPCLPQTGRKLSPFQMLLSTLMRLRLNLPIQHIAYLFSVDRKTVSTTFRDTIGSMFSHLKPLVHWPERHYLQATMPHHFVEAFGSQVAVIVDCFEIRIERASNLKTRVQTFSHYKHQHTLKYLIGITPRGSISFISQGWEGHVSDKHVTENSGLLNKLLPGDLVLADHGFDIRDSVGLVCAKVKIPAFTGGHSQLDAKDVEEARRIAHLRVHVERMIGCVRTKYTILNGIVPVSMVLPCQGEDMTFLDKIVTVCCALTNMCPSVAMKP
uniref:THAP-type domain-containing protein n=2 Tax=Cyprinus carpio TaxID=7962 RepID=A0A9J7ZF00_CYPCA